MNYAGIRVGVRMNYASIRVGIRMNYAGVGLAGRTGGGRTRTVAKAKSGEVLVGSMTCSSDDKIRSGNGR